MIQDNGDQGKTISYLKMDIEHNERSVLPQLFKTNILDKVEQIGVEMHTGSNEILTRGKLEDIFTTNFEIYQTLFSQFGFKLVAYNPNGCMGKDFDAKKEFYAFFDLLFVK